MGFINILDSLPYKQMQEVSKYLISHFGQSTYYRARKGTRPLLPCLLYTSPSPRD